MPRRSIDSITDTFNLYCQTAPMPADYYISGPIEAYVYIAGSGSAADAKCRCGSMMCRRMAVSRH